MKKVTFTAMAILTVAPLFAQTVNWDLSPVTTSLRTLVPNVLGLICFVALLGWTAFNLFKNWDNRQEVMTNFVWALITILVGYGIVYGAMNTLLK